jgi:hypothetical protein
MRAKAPLSVSLTHRKGDRPDQARLKLPSGRWVYLARVAYERLIGPIPNGQVIWHINGDPTDCRAENLQAISRAEVMRRLRLRHHGSIQEAQRLCGRLAAGTYLPEARMIELRRRAVRRADFARALLSLCPDCRAELEPFIERIVRRLNLKAEYESLSAGRKNITAESAEDAEEEAC